ncbi:MAG: hypothetical protein WC686_04145 [Candidatus Shapirobacteria bacterium]|jgi:hypothetical protein
MSSHLPKLIALSLSSLLFSSCTLVPQKATSPSAIINQSPPQSLTPTPATIPTTAGWLEFSPSAGNFKAGFPIYPSSQSQQLAAGSISINHTQYSATDQNGNLFLIAYSTYETTASIDYAKGLQGSVNGSLTATPNGQLLRSDPGTFLTYPSIDYTIYSSSENGFLIGRNFMVGNQLYQIMISSPINDLNLFNQFAGTFELTSF